MPFFAGIAAIVSNFVFRTSKELFKWAVYVSLISLTTVFIGVIWRALSDIYQKIQGSINELGTTYGGLLGCVISSLGIDQFMTSAIGIFVSGAVFWGVTVSYILTFKFSWNIQKVLTKIL